MFVDIDAGGTANIRLELSQPVKLPTATAGRRFRLTVWHQHASEPDQVTVRVSGAAGARLDDPHGLAADGSAYVLHTQPETTRSVAVTVNGP